MRAVTLAIFASLVLLGCGGEITSTEREPGDFTRSLAGRCLADGGQAWCFWPPSLTLDDPSHRAAVGRADLFADPIPPVDLGQDFQVTALAGFGLLGDMCALDTQGRLKCWADSMFDLDGLGDDEKFGDEAVEMGDALPFFDLGTEQRVAGIAVSTPGWFCAWFEDGRVKCFGRENYGVPPYDTEEVIGDLESERGDAIPYVDLGTDVRVKSLHGADSISQMCAVTDDGRVKCWGEELGSHLPTGGLPHWGDEQTEMGDELPFVDLGAGFVATQVAIGQEHTCALSEAGEVRCWGKHIALDEDWNPVISGMCGRGDDVPNVFWYIDEFMGDNLVPVDLGRQRAAAISAGSRHSCALLVNGDVKCWGWNAFGQLGQGDRQDRGVVAAEMGDALSPVALGEGHRATALHCWSNACCAVRDEEDVVCWGQLGVSGDIPEAIGDEPGEMGNNLEVYFTLR